MKSHVLGFIFARGGSKGVPRKNIRPLAGKPLIAYSIETGLACPTIEKIIVSTDDQEIATIARQYGADIPFIRPAELARDDSPEWLAWKHAVQFIQSTEGKHGLDVFVALPVTSPFRSVEDVEKCVQLLLESDADVVITVTPSTRNPYYNMVKMDEQQTATIVIQTDSVVTRRQSAPPVYDMTTVAYAARPQFILTADRMFAGKVKAVVVPPERALDIDTVLDFEFAEFLMYRRLASEGI